MRSMTRTSLEEQIEGLNAASLAELRERWEKDCGTPPSKHVSRKLLIRTLAYEAQAKVLGGLKTSTRRKLVAIAKGQRPDPPKKLPVAAKPVPGTRLLREWHGKTHIVEVTGSGFVWDGEEYSSLSAAAKAITGAKWNGRRFFGLPGIPRDGSPPLKEEAA